MEFNERFYREEPVALAEEHKIGVIVVDHGSRRADANNLLHKVRFGEDLSKIHILISWGSPPCAACTSAGRLSLLLRRVSWG